MDIQSDKKDDVILLEGTSQAGKKMPFISIVIPVFNMAEEIDRCLRSILDQDFAEMEIIVVDDGSSDDTGRIVAGFAAKDPRIQYFFEQNAGVSCARNAGMKIARGKYLLFIDADDELEDSYLQNIAEKAKADDADMMVWGIKRCFSSGYVEAWAPEIEGVLDRKAFLSAFPAEQYGHHKGLYGFVPNKLVKKEIVERFHLCFDTALDVMEDYDFFLGCYAHCNRFLCFPETGYRYHLAHETSKHRCVSYSQLISVQIKCANLLNNEGVLTAENERLLFKAIGNLSFAAFLEMREITRANVKSLLDFIWENNYCIPAIRQIDTRWQSLRRLILRKDVLGLMVFVKLWQSYLSFRKGKTTRD